MNLPCCHLPDQPGIHGTKQKLASFRSLPCTLHMIQNPSEFCRGKVRVRNQTCPFTDHIPEAVCCQRTDHIGSPPALPDNGIVHRLPRCLIPYNRCLSLVGNSNRGNVLRPSADLPHCLRGNRNLGRPDIHRIMLHPARMRIDLLKLPLRDRTDIALFIKQYASGACRSCVKRHNILIHFHSGSSREQL